MLLSFCQNPILGVRLHLGYLAEGVFQFGTR